MDESFALFFFLELFSFLELSKQRQAVCRAADKRPSSNYRARFEGHIPTLYVCTSMCYNERRNMDVIGMRPSPPLHCNWRRVMRNSGKHISPPNSAIISVGGGPIACSQSSSAAIPCLQSLRIEHRPRDALAYVASRPSTVTYPAPCHKPPVAEPSRYV